MRPGKIQALTQELKKDNLGYLSILQFLEEFACSFIYKEKRQLVTGSTAGIGKAIAASLAAEGANVLINGRREEKVIDTIHEIQDRHAGAKLESVVRI